MLLLYLYLAHLGVFAQETPSEISYSGVYKGSPLFIQNPYSPRTQSYCIREIVVNKRRVDIDYNRSALMLDFSSTDKFAPVAIHILYADSTCVPVLLNPDAIAFHSVFGFDRVNISDSTISWQTRGEQANGTYQLEKFSFGDWEPLASVPSKGVYGGSSYEYFPNYEEGINKYRVRYTEGDLTLYSAEVEYVFYPSPIEFKRKDDILLLSRAAAYIVYDAENYDVLSGTGREIDISSLASGEYMVVFNENQAELFRKNDPVKVIRKPKSDN